MYSCVQIFQQLGMMLKHYGSQQYFEVLSTYVYQKPLNANHLPTLPTDENLEHEHLIIIFMSIKNKMLDMS